ncbi:MAG: hypothetical protein FJ267_04095 [Planctomycetes bacterium]|nr:hypothetical protein [Planctomycetota bacterium]
MIYSFRPEKTLDVESPVSTQFSIPDQATLIADIRGMNGSEWIVFQGRGPIETWLQLLDSKFGESSVVSKSVTGELAMIKYRWMDQIVDIEIRKEKSERLLGVAWIMKVDAKEESNSKR